MGRAHIKTNVRSISLRSHDLRPNNLLIEVLHPLIISEQDDPTQIRHIFFREDLRNAINEPPLQSIPLVLGKDIDIREIRKRGAPYSLGMGNENRFPPGQGIPSIGTRQSSLSHGASARARPPEETFATSRQSPVQMLP